VGWSECWQKICPEMLKTLQWLSFRSVYIKEVQQDWSMGGCRLLEVYHARVILSCDCSRDEGGIQ